MSTKLDSNQLTPQTQEITRRDVLKALAIVPAALALPAITQEAPNDWLTRQAWRQACPITESVSLANAARLQTWELDLYPTLYPDHESNPAHVANLKGALAQIIEELGEDDLEGVYRVARLFALFPDTEKRVQARQLEGWDWQARTGETEHYTEQETPKPSPEAIRQAYADMEAVIADLKATIG